VRCHPVCAVTPVLVTRTGAVARARRQYWCPGPH
jgi:hypothetical protein